MKRKLIMVAMCASIVFTTQSSVFAKAVITKVDGYLTELKVEPTFVDGNLFMDIYEIGGIVGAEVSVDVTTKTATLKTNNTTLQITAGNKKILINGTESLLPATPKMENNKFVIPVRKILEIFGSKVEYNAKTSIFSVKTSKSNKSILDPKLSTDEKKMSYNEATALAILNNSNIKNLIENVEYIEAATKDMKKDYFSLTTSSTGESTYEAQSTYLRGIDAYTSQVELSKFTQEITKSSSEFALRAIVSDIKTAEINSVVLSESIKLSEVNIKNLTAKHKAGLTSDTDLNLAKQQLIQQKTLKTSADLNMKNKRVALNRLLGKNVDEVLNIEYTPVAEKFSFDLKTGTYAKMYNDPEIQQKEETLRVAQFNYDTIYNSFNNVDTKRLEAKNKISEAERALADAKYDMEKNIRETALTLESTLETIKSQKIELDNAKTKYDNLITNFAVGNVTIYQVNQGKQAILSAEADLLKSKIGYDLMYFKFNRPFLL